MNLTDSVALVTGGARGAGRGVALAFAHAGADVVIADLLGSAQIAAEASLTCELIEATGRKAFAVQCDVRSEESVGAMTQAAITQFGRLDHVVVNAGVIEQGPIAEMSLASWQRVVDVNLTGAWLTCRAAAPVLSAQKSGSITIVSSVAAYRGGADYSAYCATKAGLGGLNRALSHELAAHQVRVNLIAPGYIQTDMWMSSILGGSGSGDEQAQRAFADVIEQSVPLGRAQTPGDIGEAAVYLAAAANVTGAELIVDGGRIAGP